MILTKGDLYLLIPNGMAQVRLGRNSQGQDIPSRGVSKVYEPHSGEMSIALCGSAGDQKPDSMRCLAVLCDGCIRYIAPLCGWDAFKSWAMLLLWDCEKEAP